MEAQISPQLLTDRNQKELQVGRDLANSSEICIQGNDGGKREP
jgi:hypothetical protein